MKSFFILVLSLFISFPIMAGPRDTGGGNAVVQFQAPGVVTQAQLLDLYEGKMMAGLEYMPWDQALSAYDIAKIVLARLDSVIGSYLVTWKLDDIYARFKFLPAGTGLTPIADYSPVILPKELQVMQLASFYVGGDGFIYIDSDIWNQLDRVHQAGLIVHEVVYSFLRFNRETNSDRARKLVALGFSTQEIPTVAGGLPQNGPAEVCRTLKDGEIEAANPFASFRVYQLATGLIGVRFFYLKNMISLARTEATGRGTWPISQTQDGSLSFEKLESLFEPNLQVSIHLYGVPQGKAIGEISLWNGETSVRAPFTCSVY